MATDKLPLWAMPRMSSFLTHNAPWEALITNAHVELRPLAHDSALHLNSRLTVTPWLVPHRDEYSETVAFLIACAGGRSVLFLPDIDGWDAWSRPIEEVLSEVDLAFLDGTFFDDEELPHHRDPTQIPHPRIASTLKRLSPSACDRVHFIHLNHTNPALDQHSDASRQIQAAGCHIAEQGATFTLGAL